MFSGHYGGIGNVKNTHGFVDVHEIRRIRDTQCAVFGNGIFTILDVDKKRKFRVLFQSAIGRSDRNLSCSNLLEVLNSLCACVVWYVSISFRGNICTTK